MYIYIISYNDRMYPEDNKIIGATTDYAAAEEKIKWYIANVAQTPHEKAEFRYDITETELEGLPDEG